VVQCRRRLPEPLQHTPTDRARWVCPSRTARRPHTPARAHPDPDPDEAAGVAARHAKHVDPPDVADDTVEAKTTKPGTSAHKPAAHVATPPPNTVTPPSQPPAFPARPTKGPHRIDPKPQQKPPSKNSDNTPAGYPTDWRDRAADAAANGLWDCSHVTVLDPTACPQSTTASGAVSNIHWALLNDPRLSAAAIAHTTLTTDGTMHTVVTVYERFQMEVLYTAGGISGSATAAASRKRR
jgi:hypothetical protein